MSFRIATLLFIFAHVAVAESFPAADMKNGSQKIMIADQTLTVVVDNRPPMSFDLSPVLKPGEMLTVVHDAQVYRSSPDGRYLPLFAIKSMEHAAILSLDLETGVIDREIEWDDFNFLPIKTEWLTTRHFYSSMDMSYKRHVFCDIETGKSRILEESLFPVWNGDASNCADLYKGLIWYNRREVQTSFPEARLLFSDALRYNGYWVYPKPMSGFLTREEYKAWKWSPNAQSRTRNKDDVQPIREFGVVADNNHLLSRAVFLGESNWIGFFEQVFPIGSLDQVLEANAVILDAHAVAANPPLPENIRIIKREINFKIVPHGAQYIDLSMNLVAQWNADTQRLELWKYCGLDIDENRSGEKLGEIAVDLKTMVLGEFLPTGVPSEIKWSWYVTNAE